MSLGVIILTGGASSRMGEDKALLDWNGRAAIDRLAQLAKDVEASHVVTAGARAFNLPFAVEDPPGGGPVAGLVAAAMRFEDHCARVLVLAVDAPTLQAPDIAPLLASGPPGACFEGLHLPLTIDLAAVPFHAGQGWSVRHFIEVAGLSRLSPPPEALARLRGANTPAERAVLLADLVALEVAQGNGAA